MVIAIDGPAGAGKSTVAKILAQRLGFIYVDTGAMYRALTLKVLKEKIDVSDKKAVVDIAKNTRIELKNYPDGTMRIFLDSVDVSDEIRRPTITKFVSDIARIPQAREALLELQREMGKRGNVVMDGRDIGTVVFPDAEKKFFLDADFQERVERRFKELRGLGQNVTRLQIEEDLRNRDRIDSNREVAPLRKAEDAVYVDTTEMTIEGVVQRLLQDLFHLRGGTGR